LIRQQKEKLKVLSKDTSGAGRREKESLLSSDHLLLRQLVMSSITQLAEIAYDTGSFGLGGREGERELDEIDDDDKEVAGTSLQSSSITERWSSLAGRSRSKGQSPEAVREVEQQLQEALAKQFDTNDVTVKIITLPEDQVQEEMETEGGVEGGTGREDDLANAMSLLLDSLLNGSDEPVSEDKERQSELAAGYDQVWGRQPRKRRTLKDTL
jgi:hypothetical protein